MHYSNSKTKGPSMLGTNYLAVVVAAVAAFVVSAVWYAAFGNAWMELRGIDPATAAEMGTPAWKMLFVVVQSLTVAFMFAYFVVHLGIVDWKGAVRLGSLILGFPCHDSLGLRRSRERAFYARGHSCRRLARKATPHGRCRRCVALDLKGNGMTAFLGIRTISRMVRCHPAVLASDIAAR